MSAVLNTPAHFAATPVELELKGSAQFPRRLQLRHSGSYLYVCMYPRNSCRTLMMASDRPANMRIHVGKKNDATLHIGDTLFVISEAERARIQETFALREVRA